MAWAEVLLTHLLARCSQALVIGRIPSNVGTFMTFQPEAAAEPGMSVWKRYCLACSELRVHVYPEQNRVIACRCGVTVKAPRLKQPKGVKCMGAPSRADQIVGDRRSQMASLHRWHRETMKRWDALCARLQPGPEMDVHVSMAVHGPDIDVYPPYSTDLHAVLQTAAEEGNRVTLARRDNQLWVCQLEYQDWLGVGEGITLAEAIARALLDMYCPSDDELRHSQSRTKEQSRT